MLYGILLEAARKYIISSYGESIWKSVAHELQLPNETFDFCGRYDQRIMFQMCECK